MNRVLLLLAALLCLPVANARPKNGSRHAWDRPVGYRIDKRIPADGRPPVRRHQLPRFKAPPQLIEEKIRALEAYPDVRVKRITPDYALVPVYRIDLPARSARAGAKPLVAVIGGGMHGNEPVGAHSAPAFMKWAAKNKDYRRRFHTTAFIKVDPYGTRETPYGVNHNRCFRDGRWTPETTAIRRSLGKQPVDVFVDLHGTDGRRTRGSWLIRAADDGRLSRHSLAAMRTDQLWDVARKQGSISSDTCNCDFDFHALGGVTSNSTGTFKWFMEKRGTPYSYTLETPNHLAPEKQIRMALKLLRSKLYNVAKHGDPRRLPTQQ